MNDKANNVFQNNTGRNDAVIRIVFDPGLFYWLRRSVLHYGVFEFASFIKAEYRS